MNPKEKAEELIKKFSSFAHWDDGASNNNYNSQMCALIAVDEIIDQWIMIDTYLADGNGQLNPNLKFWKKVKQEIEKL
jgi:hypothetical protein